MTEFYGFEGLSAFISNIEEPATLEDAIVYRLATAVGDVGECCTLSDDDLRYEITRKDVYNAEGDYFESSYVNIFLSVSRGEIIIVEVEEFDIDYQVEKKTAYDLNGPSCFEDAVAFIQRLLNPEPVVEN